MLTYLHSYTLNTFTHEHMYTHLSTHSAHIVTCTLPHTPYTLPLLMRVGPSGHLHITSEGRNSLLVSVQWEPNKMSTYAKETQDNLEDGGGLWATKLAHLNFRVYSVRPRLGTEVTGHVPGSVRAVGRQDCANLKLASQMLKLGDHLGQPVPEQGQCPPRVSLRCLRLRDWGEFGSLFIAGLASSAGRQWRGGVGWYGCPTQPLGVRRPGVYLVSGNDLVRAVKGPPPRHSALPLLCGLTRDVNCE